MAHDNTTKAVHFEAPLDGLSLSYRTEREYLADKIFPVVNVEKESDLFYKFDPHEENRETALEQIAPGALPASDEVSHSTGRYAVKEYGKAVTIWEREAANEDAMLNVRGRKLRQKADQMLIGRDRAFLDTFVKTGVWGQEYTGVAGTPGAGEFKRWNDAASTPLDDFLAWQTAFQLKTYGYKFNKMLISTNVKNALLQNTQLLGRINGGASINVPAMEVPMSLLSQHFGVEMIEMDAVVNTAAEGATESQEFMAGDGILLTYTPEDAGLDTAASGLIFSWNGMPNSSYQITNKSYTGDHLRERNIVERIQMRMNFDMQVTGADLGVFINSPIA